MSSSIKLPDSIYTPRQVLELARDLEHLSEQLQRGQVLNKFGLKEQNETTDKLSPLLLDLMRNSSTTISMTGDVQDLIAAVEVMKRWPTLHLTLAAPATKSQKLELVQWFRTNLGSDLLFQFVFDPELIGGMVVRTPAREYDWSFRSRLLANTSNLDLTGAANHVG